MTSVGQHLDMDRTGATTPTGKSPGPMYAVLATASTDRADEIDLLDVAVGAWRRRVLFLLTFAVSLAGAGALLTLQRPMVTLEMIVAAGQVGDQWTRRNLANQFKDLYLPAAVEMIEVVSEADLTRIVDLSAVTTDVISPADARISVSSRWLDEAALQTLLQTAYELQQAGSRPEYDSALAILTGEAQALTTEVSQFEASISTSTRNPETRMVEVGEFSPVLSRLSVMRMQIAAARPDRLIAAPRRLKDQSQSAILRWGVAVIGSVLVASLAVLAACVVDATRDRLRESNTPS